MRENKWIMFKAFVIGILIGVLFVLAGAWFYFTTGWAPVAVADPPMLFEKKLAHGALNARIGKFAHTDPAPVPVNEATYLAGADVYKQNCAVCHGLPGQGQTAIAKGMFPKPPELFHGTGVTDDPTWETYWKAKNGIRLTGMPEFKGTLSDTQLWQVSVLLANADKISPAVKAALASTPSAPPSTPPADPVKK
jgi:mono/diheme cytochrome c family protein